jgi:hypothetical protein
MNAPEKLKADSPATFADLVKDPRADPGRTEGSDEVRTWARPRSQACCWGRGLRVRYEAKKTRRSASSVKKAVKKVGNSRKKVEKRLRG